MEPICMLLRRSEVPNYNYSTKIPYITMWQHWLGNTKPKKAPKPFQKVATEFIFYRIFY